MTLAHGEILQGLITLGVLLLVARALGELAHRIALPIVVGELLGGVLLGPTVLGTLAPAWHAALLPQTGGAAVLLEGLTMLAVTLFFFVAGLEVELSAIWRQGRPAAAAGLIGMAVPFGLTLGGAWLLPAEAMGPLGAQHPWAFALLLATVLSVTAVAVAARILLDLDLYRSDFGVVLVAGALLNDLVAWIIVSVLIGSLGAHAGGLEPATAVVLVLVFTAVMLAAVRPALRWALPWVQAHTSWPGGLLGLGLSLAVLSAAVTQAIGVHSVFGAFLAGVALGDSPHLRERSRFALRHFISIFFAPLFFVSVGLRTDLGAGLDWRMLPAVALLGIGGKLLGGLAASRLARMDWRIGWALGFGLNARGSMDLILALLALQMGVFSPQLFASIVVVALACAMVTGPAVRWALKVRVPREFLTYLSPKGFVPRLAATGPLAAIDELAAVAARAGGLDAAQVARAVRAREAVMHTGLGRRLAVPHARIAGLSQPVLALGLSETGIDFDAPDDLPTRIVVLLLVPEDDPAVQLELLRNLIAVLGNPRLQPKLLSARSYTELAALVRSRGEEGTDP